MSNWYVSSVAWTAVTAWAAGATLAVGALRRQLATPTVGNERVFRVSAITTGITGGSEPAWTLTKAATTADNGVTWTEVTGNETYQTPGAWTAPHARIGNAIAVSWTTGDTIYVAANHAETQSTAISIQAGVVSATLNSVICVDSTGTGHVPPQAGDLRTTATMTTTGNTGITIGFGNGYWYGITFIAGSGASGTATITLGNSSFSLVNRYDSCSLQIATTGVSSLITSGANAGGTLELNNTTISFAANGQNLQLRNINLVWRNTAFAALGTATTNGVITDGGSGNQNIYCEGLDFSNLTHTRLFSGTALNTIAAFVNCRINASTVICATANAGSRQGNRIDSIATDSGGLVYRNERYNYQGALTTDAAIYAASGASDGTTSFAWKIVSSATAAWEAPFAAFDIAQWNSATGSGKTVSFEAVANAAAVLTNAQLWVEVGYFGTSSSTLQSLATSGLANILAASSNITTSSTSWGAGATARANAHAYVLGDIIKLASNTGRIFFCTTAGTSAGSEPVGYASAVDGGSVTDNTAVFRAGVRMTVSTPSLTPQVAGLLRATAKIAAVSTTCYIDPLLTVV